MFAWPAASDVPELSADEVHVWAASLHVDPERLTGLSALLNPEEQQRAARYTHLPSQAQFIVARGLLRTLLGRYLNVAPHAVCFASNPQGKPLLASTDVALQFNVSHSHDVVLLAFARCGQVGVDVEQVRPYATHLDMARRFFTPGEAAALCALPPEASQEAFFHVWTRKEAFLKAIGLGLAHGLERFEVSIPPNDPARILYIDGDPRAGEHWTLEGLTPAPSYLGAVAVEGQGRRVRCGTWAG